MAIVSLDTEYFSRRYPTINVSDEELLQDYFDEACLMVNNTDKSIVVDIGERKILLHLLMAHFATLNGFNNPAGTPSTSGLVGRVSSATEGSVTVSMDYGASIGEQQAYFLQTPFGADFWAKTKKYRSFRYVPYE